MAGQLTGKRIAVLTTDGVEKVELVEPLMALREAGATVEVLAPHDGSVQAMDHDEKSGTLPVDRRVGEADPADYDGLVLPGGVINADHLRIDEDAVNFAASFLERGMPVGVICHGPWLLIETGLLEGPHHDVLPHAAHRPRRTPAPTGWTKRSATTRVLSRVGGHATSPPSAPRSSRSSRKGATRAGRPDATRPVPQSAGAALARDSSGDMIPRDRTALRPVTAGVRSHRKACSRGPAVGFRGTS